MLFVLDRVDQHWRQTTKQPEPESPSDADPDVYDLVLTDGTHKAKASLDARHNDVLRRGGLVDYVIELDRSMVEWCYDDSRVPARRLMVIRKFNLCEDMVSVDKSVCSSFFFVLLILNVFRNWLRRPSLRRRCGSSPWRERACITFLCGMTMTR